MSFLEISICGYKILYESDIYGNQFTVYADAEAVEMLS